MSLLIRFLPLLIVVRSVGVWPYALGVAQTVDEGYSNGNALEQEVVALPSAAAGTVYTWSTATSGLPG